MSSTELQEECLDCRLVRVACTDELRDERCSCTSGEVCCNNCCGGQNCVPRISGSTCPDGSNPVNCFVRPCQFASCLAYPDATCIDSYCGGCNADWYVDGNLVDCNVCSLPLESGLCLAAFRRWGFRNGRCEEFTYGGCGGNANNFQTLSECADTCGGGCPDGSTPVNCLVSPCETATCAAFPEADCVDNFCGGCNADWFEDGEKVDCDSDVCSLPVVLGPCRGYFPSWGFQNGRCEDFIYGGCQGNGNRFSTEEQCIEECGQNVCSLPIEIGPCDAYFPSWGFQNGRCEKFIYGGCQGNANRFSTEAECVEECGQNVCILPIELGPCKGYFPRWGFQNGRCEKFIYGGCHGNANSFPTEADCVAECDVCQLPLVTGPCEALIPRWGFHDDECVEFTYGGCEGNDNNFKSLADCIDECGPN